MSTYTGLAIFRKDSFALDKLPPAVSRNNTAVHPQHICRIFYDFKGRGERYRLMTREGRPLLGARFTEGVLLSCFIKIKDKLPNSVKSKNL